MNELIVLFRAIPELVTALGGDEERIRAYVPSFPSEVDSVRAVQNLGHPELLLMFQGTVQGIRGGTNVWQHNFSIAIGTPEEDTEPFVGPFAIWTALINGKPTTRGGEQEFWNLYILDGAFSLQPPSLLPRREFIGVDQAIDYMEVQFSVQEGGQNP